MGDTNGRKVVLLAEDDNDQAYLARRMLERRGFVVVTAVDGEQTLALAEALRPNAMVLDLVMPGIDGFEVLKAIRERAGYKPPIVAVSSFRGYLPKARELGADEALRKPYSQRLVDHVAALMNGKTGPQLRRYGDVDMDLDEDVAGEDEPSGEDLRSAATQEVLELIAGEGRDPDPMLQDLTERASRLFDVRGCLVSLVTRESDVWVAGTGVPGAPGRVLDRAVSLCAHSISTRASLVVHDAEENPFFRDSEARRMGIRFYAGVPLSGRTGEPLGSLCLLDHRPRDFSWMDLELLGSIARAVVGTIEWRERAARPLEPVSSFRHLDTVDPDLSILGRDGFVGVLRHLADRAMEYPEEIDDRLSLVVAQATEERMMSVVEELRQVFPIAMLGRLARNRIGVAVVGTDVVVAKRLAQIAVGGAAGVTSADVSSGADQACETLRLAEASFEQAASAHSAPPPRDSSEAPPPSA